MNREDIIRMAREAGAIFVDGTGAHPYYALYEDELVSFASLVAAAKQEECAKLCEDNFVGLNYSRIELGPCLTEFPKDGGDRHDGMTYAIAIRALK